MKTIKYFNPNKVEKNSRKGVVLNGKIGFTKENMRLAMCEANFIFKKLNTKKA